MKVRTLIAMLALCGVTAANAATQTNDYGSFSVSYDDSTIFGGPSFSFGSDGGVTGFGWNIPNSVKVLSMGGATVENTFVLPDFTITANNGYLLSGLTASVGNLVFTELGGATTYVSALGTVQVNGSEAVFGGSLTKTTTDSGESGYATGYYSGSVAASFGSFSSLTVTGAELVLGAGGGMFGNITTNPQNEIKFSLIAAAVPEPESYAMFLAGLGLIGAIARRGKQQA